MPKAQLDYYKCTQCRKDRQKCLPRDRVWPDEKCARCIKYKYNCSANVSRRGELPPAPATPAPSMRNNSKSTSPVPLQTTGCNEVNGLDQSHLFPSVVTPVTESLTPSPQLSSHGYMPPSYHPYNNAQRPMTSSPNTQINVAPSLQQRRISLNTKQHRYAHSLVSFNWLKNLNFTEYSYGLMSGYLSQLDINKFNHFYTVFNRRLRTLNPGNPVWEYQELEDLDVQRIIEEESVRLATTGANQLFQPNVTSDWSNVQQYQQHGQSVQAERGHHSPLQSMHMDGGQQPTIHLTPASSTPNNYVMSSRWRELIEGMGGNINSPELLLLDPTESAAFINKIENGTEEEFYILKSEICAPGSNTREICLKLSGIARLIAEIEENKSTATPEIRRWIASEIQRRIREVIKDDPVVTSTGRTSSLQETHIPHNAFLGLTGLSNDEYCLHSSALLKSKLLWGLVSSVDMNLDSAFPFASATE